MDPHLVCQPVVAECGPFRAPHVSYPVIKTFKLSERKESDTPIHPRWSERWSKIQNAEVLQKFLKLWAPFLTAIFHSPHSWHSPCVKVRVSVTLYGIPREGQKVSLLTKTKMAILLFMKPCTFSCGYMVIWLYGYMVIWLCRNLPVVNRRTII